MAEITPTAIRSVVTDDEFGGFRVTIPAPATGRMALGCGLAFWPFVTVLDLLYIVSDPVWTFWDGIAFLGLWVVIGLGLLASAVYTWTGRQVLRIEGKTLVLSSEFAGYSRSQTFDLSGLRNLRAIRGSDFQGSSYPQSASAVAFDSDGKTYRFGVGLSEVEVIRLVKTIRTRFPIRDDPDDAEPLPVIT